jgi:hypothetical protein
VDVREDACGNDTKDTPSCGKSPSSNIVVSIELDAPKTRVFFGKTTLVTWLDIVCSNDKRL